MSDKIDWIDSYTDEGRARLRELPDRTILITSLGGAAQILRNKTVSHLYYLGTDERDDLGFGESPYRLRRQLAVLYEPEIGYDGLVESIETPITPRRVEDGDVSNGDDDLGDEYLEGLVTDVAVALSRAATSHGFRLREHRFDLARAVVVQVIKPLVDRTYNYPDSVERIARALEAIAGDGSGDDGLGGPLSSDETREMNDLLREAGMPSLDRVAVNVMRNTYRMTAKVVRQFGEHP